MRVENLAPGEHSISISFSEDASKCELRIDGEALENVASASLFASAEKPPTYRIVYYRTNPDGSYIARDGFVEFAALEGEITGQFDGKILIEQ